MGHITNTVAKLFAEKANEISKLKLSDAHFAHLLERYEEVNTAIHRMESQLETVADDVLERLKKERLRFTDEIAQKLK